MLIPKKNGKGFLKQPLFHRDCPLNQLSYQVGFDFYGLDGYLCVNTGFIEPCDYDRLTEKVVMPVAELLGFPYLRVDHEEFWGHFPQSQSRLI